MLLFVSVMNCKHNFSRSPANNASMLNCAPHTGFFLVKILLLTNSQASLQAFGLQSTSDSLQAPSFSVFVLSACPLSMLSPCSWIPQPLCILELSRNLLQTSQSGHLLVPKGPHSCRNGRSTMENAVMVAVFLFAMLL